MPSFEEWDAITQKDLRDQGITKWADPDRIGAFIAEMDFPAPEAVRNALAAEVDQGLFAYTPPAHMPELSRATAEHYERLTGWNPGAEHVHRMADVVSCFKAAVDYFTAADASIVVPTPAYMPFLSVPPLMRRNVVEVPMVVEDGRHVHDLEAIDSALAQNPGATFVLCNPHNPTGRVFEREELEAICEVVDRNGARVFADEIWMPVVFSPHRHIPYASLNTTAAGHTITATAASKGYNIPGLKCAQLITSNDADEAEWQRVGVVPMKGAATLGMVGTVAAYDQASDWMSDAVAYVRRNRDAVVDFVHHHLPEATVTAPEGTFVAWLDLRAYGLEEPPAEFLAREAGVVCTDGRSSGEVGQGHVRLIFATPYPILMQALQQIAEALNTLESV